MELTRRISAVDLVAERAAFLAEMRGRSNQEDLPNNDPVISAFSDAALFLNGRLPSYRGLTNAYLLSEPVETPAYRHNKYFKAHQALLLDENVRREVGYPQNFTKSGAWIDFIGDRLADSQSPDYIQVLQNLTTRALQTNRWNRAKVPAYVLAALATREIVLDKPTVHEYGSAGGLVLNALAAKTFSETGVCNSAGKIDRPRSAAFNVIARLAPYGQAIGIDAQPPITAQEHNWVKSCTLEPHQLESGNELGGTDEAEYDLLAMMKPPSVRTIKSNFLRMSEKNRAILRNNPADVAFLSHVLAQNTRSATKIINFVLSNMKKRGAIVVNEYARVNPRDPQRLQFLKRWYSEPWLCQTLIMSAAHPEEGFFPIFEWDTARCDKLRYCRGIGRLALEFQDFA